MASLKDKLLESFQRAIQPGNIVNKLSNAVPPVALYNTFRNTVPQIQQGIQNIGQRFPNIPTSYGQQVQQAVPQAFKAAIPGISYYSGQVVNPIRQGIQQFQQPGLMNKGMGAAQIAGGVFSATPQAIPLNAAIGMAAGSMGAIRNKQPIIQGAMKGATTPTSLAQEGLGIQNPLLALGTDIVLSHGISKSGNAVRGIKGIGLNQAEGRLASSLPYLNELKQKIAASGQMTLSDVQSLSKEVLEEAKVHKNILGLSTKEIEYYARTSPRSLLDKLHELSTGYASQRSQALSMGQASKFVNIKGKVYSERGDITSLEKQLDQLTGYQGNGLYHGKEQAIRQKYIDNALESAPSEIKSQIQAIQSKLDAVRSGGIPNVKSAQGSKGDVNTKLVVSKPQGEVIQPQKQFQTKQQPLANPKIPLKIQQNDTLESIISPNVYSAEPNPSIKENKSLQEWSDMVFKQEGGTYKNIDKIKSDRLKANLNIITKNIEEKTNSNAFQKLKNAQTEAQKSFVTNKKGKIILSKGGSPLDSNVVSKAVSWKDKPRLSYSRETMERNFEDIMGKDAPMMKERYIAPVKKAEANRQRWINQEREQIKSLGIKARSKESKLLQQYGEGMIKKEELINLSPKNYQKIIQAEKVLRGKYDKYLTEINSVLTRNGYDAIPKRKDYFRHFTEVQGLLEQFGIPVRDNALPTDINGLTADFKPGKNFFSSALQRKTDVTDYDAIQGIDTYIDGASKQIFHTDNIQNLRLLDKSIRETFAGTKHLSNFVADLSEYTNIIAGKKAMVDRAIESLVGRNIYGATNRLKKQVGANMVGANVSSALTNIIPFTQSLATTDKPSFVKGMMQTIVSTFKDDGFVNRSDFLTTRIGSDRLAMNIWEKTVDKSMWLMKTLDKFVSGTIVRSKYAEGIKQGLSPQQAMKRADEWAGKVLAGRGLGDMPTLFNSQTLGFLTQFQLEVNNQMSFMAKDIPRNFNKVGAASALGQLFLYSYIFNTVYEKMFGRRPAFDPIGVAQKTYEDYTNPNMKEGQATKNLVQNVSDQLPFTSALTGGRIPIGSAIPNPLSVASGDSTMSKEAKKLFYLLPPTGGSQIKKTIEGVQAYNQGGSFSDSGRVRYPIIQTPINQVRTAIGGQYSTPEAQQYFREGITPLGDKQSDVFKQSNNKPATYQTFMDKREQGRLDDKAKEELKQSGQTSIERNNKIYLLENNGNIKTIDLSFQPERPRLTGSTELDKKLVSRFNSQISSKINDITDLYVAGKMTQDEANTELLKLKNLKTRYAAPKKGRKLISDAKLLASFSKAMKAMNPPYKTSSKKNTIKTVKPIKLRKQVVKSLR